MRVLIVEDDVKMANILHRGLHQEGMVVDVALNGEEALGMAGLVGYDVIVLDIMLPGIDGIETCRRLRSHDISTPVMMLTARDSVKDRALALGAGADDYLVKFSFADLLARLRMLAPRSRAQHPTDVS